MIKYKYILWYAWNLIYFLNDEEACDIIGLVIVEETRTIISRV